MLTRSILSIGKKADSIVVDMAHACLFTAGHAHPMELSRCCYGTLSYETTSQVSHLARATSYCVGILRLLGAQWPRDHSLAGVVM